MNTNDFYLRGGFNPIEGEEIKKAPQKGITEKLSVFNWLNDIPTIADRQDDIVEIRFKNTRKSYYNNVNNLRLEKGDLVAVEASPGHDIGIVSLTGELVYNQLRKYGIKTDSEEIKKIYRKAKYSDVEKWKEAIDLEHETMISSRQIAADLGLNMKIGDVEYQGDKTKAIFYYIADERVDFRELIKVLANQFKIRIEMKQIGARQEAGRIGGIGACGRQLCCATWMSNFVSVTTNSARIQDVSLNPQKLAGQCSKLKCCLNYELTSYLDAQEKFPAKEVNLETLEGTYFFMKSDVFRGIMWYSSSPDMAANITALTVERVHEIQKLNRKGIKPEKLSDSNQDEPAPVKEYASGLVEDSITRFDSKKSNRKKSRGKKSRKKIVKKNENKSS